VIKACRGNACRLDKGSQRIRNVRKQDEADVKV
jgi:hypothetical protein